MYLSLRALVGLSALTTILLSSSSTTTLVQAQQPQSCGGAAFAKVGSTFYIQGGATFADNLVQAFWSLDLSTSWTTSSPAWNSISPPGPPNAFHSAGIASDGSSFITFGRDTAASANQIAPNWINTFNIGARSWTAANPSQVSDLSRRDFYAVSNLAGSKIYILGGNAGSAGTVTSNVLNTYDPSTGTMVETAMPSNAPQNSSTYAAVWVKRSSTMLIIGGSNGGAYPQSLWTYNPISGGWATQASSGPFTHSRIGHCAASNGDGTLVAVFSGFLQGAASADPNVYILNTVTWTWTAIPLSGRGRGNAACTIVDDTFIIWGGFYNNPSVSGGVPSGQENLLLLTLSTGQWKTSYTPSTSPGGAGTPGGGGGDGGSNATGTNGNGKGGLSGAAIGGICAGVAVIVAAVLFLFFRKTWKKGDQEAAKLESGGAAHPPAPTPCAGGAPANGQNGQGHHHGGNGAAAVAVAGHIPSNLHSPQPPSTTVYDPSAVYHQGVVQQPQPIGYTGYDQHQQQYQQHQQQQQQYPPYLQQAPDQTFHQHRPNTDVYGTPIQTAADLHYVDENGHLYRRSYQTEGSVPATTPPLPPGTVYYPPPPPPGVTGGVVGLDTPEKGSYDAYVGSPSHGSESPYKASISEGGATRGDSSPYHDSYAGSAGGGTATTGGAGAGAVKRPVGAPQGVATVEVPVVPGAPQAILG
ncbi:MAG: hypothetical protein J3R72DRAFT_437237 [Linnemannia gamsii]|nr:MAG: hypothetical protein J3R72DRAFT_437237 [Linnemannia gamsii]